MAHTAEIGGVGVSVSEEGMEVPVVVLEARGEYLPIFINPRQALSIERARQQLPAGRPMTHDLLIEMVTEIGGAIDQVRIDDLTDGTFYAKIDAEYIQAGDRHQLVFDARPSDAIALAVRLDCPITVTDDVLDAAGQPPETFEFESGDDRDPDPDMPGM